MKYEKALEMWLENGGILYRENEDYLTTDDDG